MGSDVAVTEAELREAEAILASFKYKYRTELPGEPPPWHAEAACWATMHLGDACRFVVFRDLGEEPLERFRKSPRFAGDGPSVHYSVDLTFRFLPDVVKQVRTAAEDEPLVTTLLWLGQQWPLSSVGIAGIGEVAIEPIARHPCLLRMYVDRVIASRDLPRLAEPRVREVARAALGLFPELAPAVAAALEQDSKERT